MIAPVAGSTQARGQRLKGHHVTGAAPSRFEGERVRTPTSPAADAGEAIFGRSTTVSGGSVSVGWYQSPDDNEKSFRCGRVPEISPFDQPDPGREAAGLDRPECASRRRRRGGWKLYGSLRNALRAECVLLDGRALDDLDRNSLAEEGMHQD